MPSQTTVNWEELCKLMESSCWSSSTSVRLPILERIHVSLKIANDSIDTKIINTISSIMLPTYTFYRDVLSKKLVIEIFHDLLELKPQLLEEYVSYILKLVSQNPATKAVSDYLNLLDWVNTFLKYASSSETPQQVISKLVQAQCFIAYGIEAMLDSQECGKKEPSKQNQHRQRMRQSVMQSISKTYVFCLGKNGSVNVENISSLLLEHGTKLKLPPTGVVILLGSITKSTIKLLQRQPSHFESLKNNAVEEFSAFIAREVILGKTPPSSFCLSTYLPLFLNEFINEEFFRKYFVPNIEKGNLRAPEQGFTISTEIYLGLNNKKVDLCKIFVESKIMSQTFSSLKSNKESVRNASLVSALTMLEVTDKGDTSVESITKFVEEVFKNLKSNLNADYKVLASKLLSKIPLVSDDVSGSIVSKLTPYVSKETNETALEHLLHAFFVHTSYLKVISDTITTTIMNGLHEKKPNLRKVWVVSLLEGASTSSATILQQYEDEILNFIKEALVHPSKLDHKSVLGCLSCLDCISSMTGTTLRDQVSVLLESLYADSNSVGYAWLYTTLSTNLCSDDRIRAVSLLKNAFRQNPRSVGLNVIKAIEDRIQDDTNGPNDSISFRFITPVLTALAQNLDDNEAVCDVLIEMLVITQYKGFNLKNGWASLVINAGIDPGSLVQLYSKAILTKMQDITENAHLSKSALCNAALKSIAYVLFINPPAMNPILEGLFQEDLRRETVASITDEDLKIWHGVEGEMVIDVLERKAQSLENKNVKDYETLKWEEDIRKKQIKKNIGAKKLSKEEQALVTSQLAKESEIRQNVNSIYLKLKRSVELIELISEDASRVDNGAEVWFPIAVNSLLSALKEAACGKILQRKGIDAFLKLSEVISNRLGLMRFYVGMATLRAFGVFGIPDNFKEEPLLELISRVLFRIKFISDKKAFSGLTLTYILPLLTEVLEEGRRVAKRNANKPLVRSEFVEEDKEEEHLLLAIEIISVHAETFTDASIPRKNILEVLLSLLSMTSKARLAKDCFMALCQNISVSPAQEDLQLILGNLLSPNQFVRATILEAIDDEFELSPYMDYSPQIFILMFDADETNREIAQFIWQFNKFEISEKLINHLFNFFSQTDSGLRLFVAKAYTAALKELAHKNPSSFHMHIKSLMDFYVEKFALPEPILDEYGLVAVSTADQKDPWEDRSTAAIAFKEAAQLFTGHDECILNFVRFLVESGALGDREALVRQEMKEAGIEVITHHGLHNVEKLIPIFENALVSNDVIAIKENVIILYGSLARHLQEDDPRILLIVGRLLDTLDTPSEDVQQAVSACISPLVPLFKPKVTDYLNVLMDKLLDSTLSRSVKRGAAWGVAGIVKGYGINALSEFDVIRNLIEASEDKRDPKRRESVAFAFECLSKSLKKFFEPYVIEVLPNILRNLGDSVPEVRDATAEATKAIMSNTTSYGVKKMIPVAVSNLDEISWRTKRGSVELLGNMAYLDPAQLSASLSTIVPQIVAVLNDSHKEVRKAADQSLNRFGEVIRNPEIQKLVPILIKAIGDPTKYTEEALDALIQTQFVHYIDGPSLALIIHVIHRGMRDRSANTKRKACKIVGNMAILVDANDLIPYLQQLVDEVEVAMVDPVPNTRATAARALGALVERLGEEKFPDLIPRLLSTLSDDTKSGDRLGSAQALAEVISGLGLSKLDELLPVILNGVTNFRSFVREGFMPLLLFLPVCFGAQFAPYISQIIQPILAGLAESDENIRDTALKAGKLVVKNYATKAIDLLLPELERGMFDENERIRLSSVQLSSELLFQVTGISSKNEFAEDESDQNNEVSKQMVEVLGEERRNRILSSLFVCRSDVSGIVRATTVDVWKALVPNTPRTVKEILPTLTGIIVVHLASSSDVLRHIAAQTLGDLVRRVGSNALSQLLPTLEKSLDHSTDSNSKQGVCIALRELIQSSSVDLLAEYQDIIVNIIRKTLVDDNLSVRESAALSFDAFQDIFGRYAVDEILPYLLNMLESSDSSEYALLALQEIMSTKSDVIFPVLIPTLLSPPIDAFRARALGSLAQVAGFALYKRLSIIINALVDALSTNPNDPQTKGALEDALEKVFCSVTDDEGMHPLLQQIMSLMKDENMTKRVVVLGRLPQFFEATPLDYSVYTPEIISQLILCFDEEDDRILGSVFDVLSILIKRQDKGMLEKLVKPAKQALQLTGKGGEELSIFKLPKGPNCILPIFLNGLMYGSNEDRESSAIAIADIVKRTPAANLRPFVTIITGPLIRVVGERFPSDIKAAILYALNMLFDKIPQFLRPFIPQLQRTFVKSLSDPSNETLRLRAAKALGSLIEYQPRVDPLVVELVAGARQAVDDGVKTAMLKALLEVVAKAGSKMSEASKSTIMNLVEEEILSVDDKLATAYARLIGSLSEIMDKDEARKILREKVLQVDPIGESGRFAILTLNSFLKDAPGHILLSGMIPDFIAYLVKAVNSPKPYLSDNALTAIGKVLLLEGERKSPFSKVEADSEFELGEENIKLLIQQLSKCMIKPESNSLDTRRLALVVVRTLARFKFEQSIEPFYDELAPSVFSCLRDVIIPVKLAAEKAYLAMFRLVEEENMTSFDNWFSTLPPDTVNNSIGDSIQVRSIGDYTRRVGKRLAKVERERIAAGGDPETVFSDRFEDEREIWAVGSVDLNSDS